MAVVGRPFIIIIIIYYYLSSFFIIIVIIIIIINDTSIDMISDIYRWGFFVNLYVVMSSLTEISITVIILTSSLRRRPSRSHRPTL